MCAGVSGLPDKIPSGEPTPSGTSPAKKGPSEKVSMNKESVLKSFTKKGIKSPRPNVTGQSIQIGKREAKASQSIRKRAIRGADASKAKKARIEVLKKSFGELKKELNENEVLLRKLPGEQTTNKKLKAECESDLKKIKQEIKYVQLSRLTSSPKTKENLIDQKIKLDKKNVKLHRKILKDDMGLRNAERKVKELPSKGREILEQIKQLDEDLQ